MTKVWTKAPTDELEREGLEWKGLDGGRDSCACNFLCAKSFPVVQSEGDWHSVFVSQWSKMQPHALRESNEAAI